MHEFQIKYVVGKQIPLTDLTYLHTLQAEIEERYPEAYEKHLCILRYQTRNAQSEVDALRKELEETRLIMKGMAAIYACMHCHLKKVFNYF